MLLVSGTNEKARRPDESVKEVSRMEELYSLDHLVSQHQDSVQGECVLTMGEERVKRRAK